MPAFIALLRGINVSGHRPVPMAPLRKSLTSRGLDSVETYKASGNVIFDANDDDPKRHAATIHDAIAADFGHDDVDVLVLRGREMKKVASSNPLLGVPSIDPTYLYAAFLYAPVSKSAFDKLVLPVRGREEARLAGKVVYLYYPEGSGTTKMSNSYFEKALRVACTTRNWRTVTALTELVAAR